MITSGQAGARADVDSRPLHIDVVTDTYLPEINGVAMTIARLVRGLAGRGHELTVIRACQAGESEAAVSYLPRPGMHGTPEIVRRSFPLPGYPGVRLGMPCAGLFRRRWARLRPDVVHIVTEGPLGWSALVTARKCGIPVSSGFHTNFHDFVKHYGFTAIASPVFAWLRRFHNHAQATVVPSPDLAQSLREAGFRNVHLVARGVDVDLFDPDRRCESLRRSWGVEPQDLVMAYIGRLAPEKNLALAAEAMARVRAADPTARLLLVGNGPSAGEYVHRRDVICAGVQRGEALAAHYASADLFLFPSLTESFGNVLCEAMASGLATVSFDYAAAQMHVEAERSGLKAPFGDSEAWLDAVEQAAGDVDLRRRLGREARASMLPLNWSRVVDDFEAVLRYVIRDRQESA